MADQAKHLDSLSSIRPSLSLPDMSALSLEEPVSAVSTPSAQIASLPEETTPTKNKQSKSNLYTPSSLTAPRLSFTPFTPRTQYGSHTSAPVTPFTPEYLKNMSLPSQLEGKDKNMGKMRAHESFGLNGETADGVGRYLLIKDIPHGATDAQISNLIGAIAQYRMIIVRYLRSKHYIIVVFHDPREALKVFLKLHTGPVTLYEGGPLVLLHCMKTDKQMVTGSMSLLERAEFQWEVSQGVVEVRIIGGYPVNELTMKGVLAKIGDVKSIEQIGHDGRRFIAEYFDSQCAYEAIRLLHNAEAGDAKLSLSHLNGQHDSSQNSSSSASAALSPSAEYTLGSAAYTPGRGLFGIGRSTDDSSSASDPFAYGSTGDSSRSSQVNRSSQSTLARIRGDIDLCTPRTSPSLRSSTRAPSIAGSRLSSGYGWNQDDHQTPYETPPQMLALSRRLAEPGTVQALVNKADISARSRQGQGLGEYRNANDPKAIPERNRVFPERILSGLDKRTTVMIKDVPNKLSRQELIDILGEVVPGEFDFVYLRFDFKNCCNALYQFIQARVGKKWNLYSSEKVLQVSYADIQGKAALINKFRNSAVMGVIEDWRPQIFYSSGSMKGQSEPFPMPDNLAIRQKSAAAQLSGFGNASQYAHGFEDSNPYDYTNASFDWHSSF